MLTYKLLSLFAGCLIAAACAEAQRPYPALSGRAVVKVVTPSGEPVTGHAELLLTDRTFRGYKEVDVSLSNGMFDEDLGQYKGFIHAMLIVRSPGYGIAFKDLFPDGKQTQLKLNRPTKVTGQVTLPNGQPAAGEQVDLETVEYVEPMPGAPAQFHHLDVAHARSIHSAFAARTDRQGRFTLKGLPEGARLVLECPDPNFVGIDQKAYTLDESTNSVLPEIRFEATSVIEGRITAQGKPAARVVVVVREWISPVSPRMGVQFETMTDADGRYRVSKLAAKSYNVGFDLTGTPYEGKLTSMIRTKIPVAAGQTVSGIDIDLSPGAIVEGTVTHPDGSPATGIYVRDFDFARPLMRGSFPEAEVDKSGHFTLRIPPGKQQVYAQDRLAPGSFSKSETIEAKEGGTIRVNLVLSK